MFQELDFAVQILAFDVEDVVRSSCRSSGRS